MRRFQLGAPTTKGIVNYWLKCITSYAEKSHYIPVRDINSRRRRQVPHFAQSQNRPRRQSVTAYASFDATVSPNPQGVSHFSALIPFALGTDVSGTVIQGKPKAASKTPKTLQYGHKKRHFTRFSRLPTKTPELNPPSSKKESLFRLKMHNSTTIFRPGAPHSGRRRLRTQLWDP